MSFSPAISAREATSARGAPESSVAAKRENPRDPATARRRGRYRSAPEAEEPLAVPFEADGAHHTHGHGLIRLVLCREGMPIFLDPSLVLAVEDRSEGIPHATGSLVTITTSRLTTGAGQPLTSPIMVRETVQQVMDAIMAAEIAHPTRSARGLGNSPLWRGPLLPPGAPKGNCRDLPRLIGRLLAFLKGPEARPQPAPSD
jgi:hypothetical protein